MTPEEAAAQGLLNSWKEIAAYLDRDVRTVMRWERSNGLPVHRLPGGPKAGVYALRSEIEMWRRGSRLMVVDASRESKAAPEVAQYEFHEGRRRRIKIVAGLCAFAAAIGAGAFWWTHRRETPRATSAPSPMRRLTFDSTAISPAISPDGRYIAFASDRDGKFDIYVQQMNGREVLKVSRNEADNREPSFSPDGSRITFRSDRLGGGIYLVETIGGIERESADRGRLPAFGPDGATICYLVPSASTGAAKLFLTSVEGGAPSPFHPEFDVPAVGTLYSTPMWSPDGKYILFDAMRANQPSSRGLWVAPVGGGPATPVESVPPLPRGKIRIYMAWTGRHIYYVEGSGVHGSPLMRANLAANPWRFMGPSEHLTSPSTVCGLARLARNGQMVLVISGAFENTVWSAPWKSESGTQVGEVRRETQGNYNQMMMSVAANGSRLAYMAYPEVGRLEIRVIDLTTRRSSVVPLSSDNRIPLIRLSPSGDRIAYRDIAGGRPLSFVVPASDPVSTTPTCRDCAIVGFFARSPDLLIKDGTRLQRLIVRTGQRRLLIEGSVIDPALSPDDRRLAFVSAAPDGSVGLYVVPVQDGPVPPKDWVTVAAGEDGISSPQWSPTGDRVYYVSSRDSFCCVWTQSIDARGKVSGEPVSVRHSHGSPSLKQSPVRLIAVTPDRLYLMLASVKSDVWTLKVDDP
jgi:Tol biopolymer transport system component